MVGIDVATKQLAGPTIQDQTRQALRNCLAIVEAGGGKLEDIAQVTVLLANPADFAGMNEEYAKVFTTEPLRECDSRCGAIAWISIAQFLATAPLLSRRGR
jgi:2-iminobutanoate/2-iminopropanoate deaminase